MPARPLIDKAILLRILDELAEYGFSDEDVDIKLVREGPVDLDLLAECKREHPHFNGSRAGREVFKQRTLIPPALWQR